MLDNADHIEVLDGFWPVANKGTVIVTSQDPARDHSDRPKLAICKVGLGRYWNNVLLDTVAGTRGIQYPKNNALHIKKAI